MSEKVSQEQLISAMERLIACGELRDGKVLIVHDHTLTPRITALRLRAIDFPLPIIVAQEGNLTTVDIEDLRKIVRDYDYRNAPEPVTEPIGGAQRAPNSQGW